MTRRGCGAVVAAAVLAGCARESTVGVRLEPGEVGRLEARGSRPVVEVHNRGPGTVAVEPGSAAFDPGDLVPGSAVMATLRGGGRVSLRNGSAEPADIDLTLRGCDGLAFSKERVEGP